MPVICPNPKCNRVHADSSEVFCSNCGTRLPNAGVVAGETTFPATGAIALPYAQHASKGARVAGFAIDFLLLVLLVPLLGAIPFLYPLVATGYILFRDSNGASFGKLLVGSQVVDRSGAPASAKQLILRNLIFVLGDIAAVLPIPFLGAALSTLGFGGLALIETFALLVLGERLGDKMAGTIVIKRR